MARACRCPSATSNRSGTTGWPPGGGADGPAPASPSGEVTSMADHASYYVRRVRTVDRRPPLLRRGTPVGEIAWTGPIRGRRHQEATTTTHKRSRRLRHLHDGDVFSGPFDLGWADDGTRLWYPHVQVCAPEPGEAAAGFVVVRLLDDAFNPVA